MASPSSPEKRCRVCDWPLRERMQDGCVEGNCSYRPQQGTEEHAHIQARRRFLDRHADFYAAKTPAERSAYVLRLLEARGEAFWERLLYATDEDA